MSLGGRALCRALVRYQNFVKDIFFNNDAHQLLTIKLRNLRLIRENLGQFLVEQVEEFLFFELELKKTLEFLMVQTLNHF